MELRDGVEIVNLNEVLGVLDRLMAIRHAKPVLAKVGEYVKHAVKERTVEDGVDAFGRPFDKYSDSYAAFREEQGQPIDHVYLMWTGGMFNAMHQEVTDGETRVFFQPSAAKSIRVKPVSRGGRKTKRRTIKSDTTEAEKAYHLHQDRPFFLLSEADTEKIVGLVEGYVDELLE